MNTVWTVIVPLLDKPPAPEDVKPGWLGFAVFLLLAAAVVFLAFSLKKHLGKVNFEEKNGSPEDQDNPRAG